MPKKPTKKTVKKTVRKQVGPPEHDYWCHHRAGYVFEYEGDEYDFCTFYQSKEPLVVVTHGCRPEDEDVKTIYHQRHFEEDIVYTGCPNFDAGRRRKAGGSALVGV
jgi:hypothetical protein